MSPILGNRLQITVVLTDEVLPPDDRLTGWHPCGKCARCVQACPPGAFDRAKAYPESFDRGKCGAKRAELAASGIYCHNCLAACPAADLADDEMLVMKASAVLGKGNRGEELSSGYGRILGR